MTVKRPNLSLPAVALSLALPLLVRVLDDVLCLPQVPACVAAEVSEPADQKTIDAASLRMCVC